MRLVCGSPEARGARHSPPGRVVFFRGPFSEQTAVSTELWVPQSPFQRLGKVPAAHGKFEGSDAPLLLILDPGSCRANSAARSGP